MKYHKSGKRHTPLVLFLSLTFWGLLRRRLVTHCLLSQHENAYQAAASKEVRIAS